MKTPLEESLCLGRRTQLTWSVNNRDFEPQTKEYELYPVR